MHHALDLNRLMRRIGHARLSRRRALLVGTAVVVVAAGAGPLVARGALDGLDDVARLPTVVDSAAIRIAEVTTTGSGSHLGFDTSRYPGDGTMRAWRADAPYEWVGYYLPAPCHKDESWTGKRATLATMKWGMAVIYVGQQTWEKTPGALLRRGGSHRSTRHAGAVRRLVRLPHSSATGERSCDASLLGASRGVADANDAIEKTLAEGFPTGTVVFLDVEHMDRVPQAMRDYYTAWASRILADGRLRPGIYAHTRNADLIHGDVQGAYEAAGRHDDPPFWIAGARDFSPQSLPSDVGHAFAAAWQGILDRFVSHAGIRLPINVSVASAPNPSGMYAASSPAGTVVATAN